MTALPLTIKVHERKPGANTSPEVTTMSKTAGLGAGSPGPIPETRPQVRGGNPRVKAACGCTCYAKAELYHCEKCDELVCVHHARHDLSECVCCAPTTYDRARGA